MRRRRDALSLDDFDVMQLVVEREEQHLAQRQAAEERVGEAVAIEGVVAQVTTISRLDKNNVLRRNN